MGCCNSKGAGDSSAGRVARWRSTGIVALRDSKLRTLPSEILAVESFVRTLDLTNNRIKGRMGYLDKARARVVIGVQIVDGGYLCNAYPQWLGHYGTTDRDGDRDGRSGMENEIRENSPVISFERQYQIEKLNSPHGIYALFSYYMKNMKNNLFLYIHGCNLVWHSLWFPVGFLSRLEKLSITGNSLVCLPKTIGNLCNVSILDLRNSIRENAIQFLQMLHTISESVVTCFHDIQVQLVLLNVSSNKLKCLPESIGGCISLEELQANGNVIEELPSSVCNLVHLKLLSLNNNLIQQLPQDLLKSCKALQNVSLHENPISMEQFQQMEGFQEFEARRKKKFDKQIDSNVMMSSTGLDEGLDI
ncbi:hypothetical protein ZIOFF_049258 [Zingiber officinale]|uniref:Uncharacterized protein n=1 Tax=Zingiber officinale TaxID=94328 RepID=A0A8J5KYD2_ZINOF|nr:hypothetical protein ZIOFF_049258 [Zingiber officinale]